MTESTTTDIALPTELVEELNAQAKRSGLTLSAYLAFLSRAANRQHDTQFADALKYAFTKYPNTMQRLAQ